MKSDDMPTLLNATDAIFMIDTSNSNDGYPVFVECVGCMPENHSFSVAANDDDYGTVDYDVSGTDSIEIRATPNCGYRFVSWNDGNTENPRSVAVSQDTTFTAIFEAVTSDTVIVHDTVTNIVYDTVTNTVHDTITNTVYDTVTVRDTIMVTNIQTDTIYLPQYIYDTVTNNIHDTTYVTNVLNDTVYLPQYIYNTVINNVHDTTYVTNVLNDTVYLPQYIYDTVYIHDTVYLIETGIHEAKVIEAKVYVKSGRIIVENARTNMVYLFDSVGRMLATKHGDGETMEFAVPAAGVYMVKIGEGKTHKVVARP